MRVLVLGRDGMLGSTLEAYLKRRSFQVSGTSRRENQQGLYLNARSQATTVSELVELFRGFDAVINCLVVRSLRPMQHDLSEGIFINALFPHLAAEACLRLDQTYIHISTDGVFSGFEGPYYEDDKPNGTGLYSASKILGEVTEFPALNIRCSIIGQEDSQKGGLLAWFLDQTSSVSGFNNVIWNGVTTVQLAGFIHRLLDDQDLKSTIAQTRVVHFSPNAPLSKYELLRKIAAVYEKQIEIIEKESDVGISRILKTKFRHCGQNSEDFSKALHELREFHLN